MVADQRILRGVSATLSWQPFGSDGESAAPSGTVTVKVTSTDGTEIKAAGTATTGTGSDPRQVVVAADEVTDLDLLTIEWTDDGDDSVHVTTAEVVSGYYFTLAEARASDPALLNEDKYPTAKLAEARHAVEDEFEEICGVAFLPRFTREIVVGNGPSLNLRWPRIRSIRSISAWDGTEFVDWPDVTYVQPHVSDSLFFGAFYGGVRYRVDYEHGFDRPPADIKAAALVRLRHRASAPLSGIPDRATTFSVAEGGTYGLMRADLSHFGIDDVDSVLARHDHRSRVR